MSSAAQYMAAIEMSKGATPGSERKRAKDFRAEAETCKEHAADPKRDDTDALLARAEHLVGIAKACDEKADALEGVESEPEGDEEAEEFVLEGVPWSPSETKAVLYKFARDLKLEVTGKMGKPDIVAVLRKAQAEQDG